MRPNITLLSKTVVMLGRFSQAAIEIPRCSLSAYHPAVRWQSSGKHTNDSEKDKGKVKGQEELEQEQDEVFGVLRKRVLDRVGDNLNQIMKYNAFELFGIKQQFNVNNSQLHQEMRRLQKILHPDRFVNAKRSSQEKSDYLSAAVNDFYSMLTNPYERAKYLLSLMLNKSQSDIEKSLEGLELGGDFLASMMDLREKISDTSCDKMELRKLDTIIRSEMDDLILKLDREFKSSNTDAILKELGKLKFLVNCHREIRERCESFSDF